MIRAGRTPLRAEWQTPSGHPVRLNGLRFWLTVGGERGGWVVAYDRPLAVEARGTRVGVHDPMVVIRLIALVPVLVSFITRRIRP